MGMSFGAKGVATPFICTNEDHIGLGHVLLSLGRHVADFIWDISTVLDGQLMAATPRCLVAHDLYQSQ